jgi:hypothetical protein
LLRRHNASVWNQQSRNIKVTASSTKDNVVEPSTWANFPTGKRIEVSSSAGANYIVQPGALAAGYTE